MHCRTRFTCTNNTNTKHLKTLNALPMLYHLDHVSKTSLHTQQKTTLCILLRASLLTKDIIWKSLRIAKGIIIYNSSWEHD